MVGSAVPVATLDQADALAELRPLRKPFTETGDIYSSPILQTAACQILIQPVEVRTDISPGAAGVSEPK